MPSLASAWTALALVAGAGSGFAAAPASDLKAGIDSGSGQVVLTDQGRPVFQYNVRTVEPGEVLKVITEGNRIYARPRGDYLHPLYGPKGEVLTRDWSPDHPHHRGIYWAWPEVEFGPRRGDLHALQHVFARPTGDVQLRAGRDYAEADAEHLWRWEDDVPIVRERAILRAYRAEGRGRAVDLEFRFLALTNGITVARRDTRLYGGLNVRLATPAAQAIAVHTDAAGALPRRAWSDLSGAFVEGSVSGVTVLQHRDNPEYPGDWIQYPELSWCQPTFPSAGTRYPLRMDQPLVLRYRLWVHSGPGPTDDEAAGLWDAYHATGAALSPPPTAPHPAGSSASRP